MEALEELSKLLKNISWDDEEITAGTLARLIDKALNIAKQKETERIREQERNDEEDLEMLNPNQ